MAEVMERLASGGMDEASSDDDAEEETMKNAFFAELEARNGGPLSWKELARWDATLSVDADADELAEGFSPHASRDGLPGHGAPVPAAGWLTPQSQSQTSNIPHAGKVGGASHPVGTYGARPEARPAWCAEEDVEDCVVTDSLTSRFCSRAAEAAAELVSPPALMQVPVTPPAAAPLSHQPPPGSPNAEAAPGRSALPEWHMATPVHADGSGSSCLASTRTSAISGLSGLTIGLTPAPEAEIAGERELAPERTATGGTSAAVQRALFTDAASPAPTADVPAAVPVDASGCAEGSPSVCWSSVQLASSAATPPWGRDAADSCQQTEAATPVWLRDASNAAKELPPVGGTSPPTPQQSAKPLPPPREPRAPEQLAPANEPLSSPPQHAVPTAATLRLLGSFADQASMPPPAAEATGAAEQEPGPAISTASVPPPAGSASPPLRSLAGPAIPTALTPTLPPSIAPGADAISPATPPRAASGGGGGASVGGGSASSTCRREAQCSSSISARRALKTSATGSNIPRPRSAVPSASPSPQASVRSVGALLAPTSAGSRGTPGAHAAMDERDVRKERALAAEVGVARSQLSALREQYEKEREEWRDKEKKLLAELTEAKQLASYRQHVMDGKSLSELPIDREELARIETDVQQQETLIQGYQRENERLSEQLKAVRDAQRADAAKGDDEARRLSLRLAELERTNTERAPETLREALERASRDAIELRETSAERESEMRHEIDKLRAAKRELESRVAGVDLQVMASEHESVKAAEAAAAASEEKRKKEVAALQSKLTWYMDNQPLIDEIDARREAAEAALVELQTEVDGIGADSSGKDGAERKGGMSDAERVTVLERQLASLQQLLEQRAKLNDGAAAISNGGRAAPKAAGARRGSKASLVELIAAAGPSAEEVQRTTYLQTRVEQLEAQVADSDGANQKRLRALRQQHDRVSAGYESRMKHLTEQLAKHESEDKSRGGLAASRTRVRELEKQIEEIRATHGKRVKDLETKLAEVNSKDASRKAAQGSKGPKAFLAGSAPPRIGVMPSARVNVQGKDKAATSARATGAAEGGDGVAAVAADAVAAEGDLEGSKGEMGVIEEAEAAAAADMEVQAMEHVMMLTASLNMDLVRLDGGLSVLTGEVSLPPGAAALCGEGDVQMRQMQRQLRNLEIRHAAREAEAVELIEAVKHVSNVEVERVRREMSIQLEGKNKEIEAYRDELDSMVHDVKIMHVQQLQAEQLAAKKPRPRDVRA